MQLIVDENQNEGDFVSYPGEISFTNDGDGRVYLEWNDREIGINLPDLLKFIGETMKGDS